MLNWIKRPKVTEPAPDAADGGVRPPSAQVIMDDRERPSGLHEALARIGGGPPRVQRLDVADLLVARRYLIERKTAADFCASLADGRLFGQMAELARQPFQVLMIVEGEFTAKALGTAHPAAVRGAMISIALDWRVPVLRSKDVEETAQIALQLAAKATTGSASMRGLSVGGPAADGTGVGLPKKRSLGPDAERKRQSLEILESLPGVGKDKAAALLRHFGSVAAVLGASVQELSEAEGIGNTLALRIWNLLHE